MKKILTLLAVVSTANADLRLTVNGEVDLPLNVFRSVRNIGRWDSHHFLLTGAYFASNLLFPLT